MVKEQMSTTVETCRDMLKTEEAIFFIKDFFGKKLAANLNLVNVSAPIAVLDGTGINDDLNGVEKPVSFSVKGVKDQNASLFSRLPNGNASGLRNTILKPEGDFLQI